MKRVLGLPVTSGPAGVSVVPYRSQPVVSPLIFNLKDKAVSLHATKALGGREGIAPTQSRLRH
jgi:hypothetical protein